MLMNMPTYEYNDLLNIYKGYLKSTNLEKNVDFCTDLAVFMKERERDLKGISSIFKSNFSMAKSIEIIKNLNCFNFTSKQQQKVYIFILN